MEEKDKKSLSSTNADDSDYDDIANDEEIDLGLEEMPSYLLKRDELPAVGSLESVKIYSNYSICI